MGNQNSLEDQNSQVKDRTLEILRGEGLYAGPDEDGSDGYMVLPDYRARIVSPNGETNLLPSSDGSTSCAIWVNAGMTAKTLATIELIEIVRQSQLPILDKFRERLGNYVKDLPEPRTTLDIVAATLRVVFDTFDYDIPGTDSILREVREAEGIPNLALHFLKKVDLVEE